MNSQGVTFFCNMCRRHGTLRRCVRCDDIYCSQCNEMESPTCEHGHLRNIRPIARRLDMAICPVCGGIGSVSRGLLESLCANCHGLGAIVEG